MLSTLSTQPKLMQPEVSSDHLKALNAFLRLTRNPAEFEAIYDIDEVLRQTELSSISIEYLKSQPEVEAIIQERYLAPIPDLDVLLTYPTDSLGYCFAAHLRANNYEPKFYRDRDVVDDISYISLRRSQTHDIHHVVTGFGTELDDEVALQAFQLAQIRSPLAIALLSGAIVNGMASSLQSPDDLVGIMNSIHQGWTMGLNAKPFFAQKWEEEWEKSVTEWREDLGIQANKIN